MSWRVEAATLVALVAAEAAMYHALKLGPVFPLNIEEKDDLLGFLLVGAAVYALCRFSFWLLAKFRTLLIRLNVYGGDRLDLYYM